MTRTPCTSQMYANYSHVHRRARRCRIFDESDESRRRHRRCAVAGIVERRGGIAGMACAGRARYVPRDRALELKYVLRAYGKGGQFDDTTAAVAAGRCGRCDWQSAAEQDQLARRMRGAGSRLQRRRDHSSSIPDCRRHGE